MDSNDLATLIVGIAIPAIVVVAALGGWSYIKKVITWKPPHQN